MTSWEALRILLKRLERVDPNFHLYGQQRPLVHPVQLDGDYGQLYAAARLALGYEEQS